MEQRPSIILYTIGSTGDVLPFIRVGAALASGGHEVTLLTHTGYAERAAKAGLGYEPIDTPAGHARFLEQTTLLNTPSGLPRFFNEQVFPSVPTVLKLIEKHARDRSILITPALYDVAPRLARELNGIALLWLYVAPMQAKGVALQKALFSKVLANPLEQVRKQAGLDRISDWEQWLSYTSPALALWPDWFGAPEAGWVPGLAPVGFGINAGAGTSLSAPLSEFLAAHPRPILVTGGTGAFHGEKFYAAALEAVRLTGKPAIVVTRFPEHLPPSLPDAVLVLNYAPFDTLLPNVGLLVHHGGIGTTAAALAAGTPQLVLAYGIDRPDNGARVQSLNLGSVFPPPRWQPQALSEAIERLTGSPETREQCQFYARRLKAQDTERAIRQVVNDFIAHNGV